MNNLDYKKSVRKSERNKKIRLTKFVELFCLLSLYNERGIV